MSSDLLYATGWFTWPSLPLRPPTPFGAHLRQKSDHFAVSKSGQISRVKMSKIKPPDGRHSSTP